MATNPTVPSDTVSLRTWIAVGGALIGAFMAVLNIQVTNSSLPDIEGGIGTGGVNGAWISTAYLIGEIIVIPMTDFLSRVFSLRRYLIASTVLFLLFSMACGQASSLPEMIVLRGVTFESHCEHHLAPIVGRAWVGYLPDRRVVGISKLARIVDIYARRLQIQERLTAQIANAIESVLKPRGVAVVVKATHHCMMSRGVRRHGADLVTSRMLGVFRDHPITRSEFLALVDSKSESA